MILKSWQYYVVKFSEYKRFEHVFEHVIKHKFEILEDGRLSNLRTQSILKSRELFKDKRSSAGKSSGLMRFFYKNYQKEAKDKDLVIFVRDNLNLEVDTKNEQMIEHMFKHLFELYRNEDENENIIKIDYNNFILFWNKKIEKTIIPKIDGLSDKRKKLLRSLFKEFSKEKFGEVLNIAIESDFLTGKTKDVFVINFDWFINKNNFIKVMEGNYNNRPINKPEMTISKTHTEKAIELTEEQKEAIRKQNQALYGQAAI